MTRKNILTTALLALAICVTGCKTTEANYRQAYQAAKEKQQQSAIDDGIPLDEMKDATMPKWQVVQGDSLYMRTDRIGFTKDGGATPDNLKRYNVVVGQFLQIFNANDMRKRLIEGGYPNAFIIQDRQPMYYVIAVTCANTTEALQAIDKIKHDPSLRLRQPLPYILQAAHLAR